MRDMRAHHSFLVVVLAAAMTSCAVERPSIGDGAGGRPLTQTGIGFYQDVPWTPWLSADAVRDGAGGDAGWVQLPCASTDARRS